MIFINKKIRREKNSAMLTSKGVNTMEEKKEQVKEVTNEKQENKPSNFGVTLLFTILAVVIGFTILLCMQ